MNLDVPIEISAVQVRSRYTMDFLKDDRGERLAVEKPSIAGL